MRKESDIKLIMELYKCHFTAKEITEMTEISYAVVINIFRGFKAANLKQHNRFNLTSQEDITHDVTING